MRHSKRKGASHVQNIKEEGFGIFVTDQMPWEQELCAAFASCTHSGLARARALHLCCLSQADLSVRLVGVQPCLCFKRDLPVALQHVLALDTLQGS